MKLCKELKKLEETLIEYHSIDIKKNQIKFQLINPDFDKKIELIFNKVSGFYFVNGYETSRYSTKDYEYGEKRELLSVVYDNSKEQKLIIKSRDTFYTGFDANFNFTLEFMEGLLLIEADEIEIDGVGYNHLIDHID